MPSRAPAASSRVLPTCSEALAEVASVDTDSRRPTNALNGVADDSHEEISSQSSSHANLQTNGTLEAPPSQIKVRPHKVPSSRALPNPCNRNAVESAYSVFRSRRDAPDDPHIHLIDGITGICAKYRECGPRDLHRQKLCVGEIITRTAKLLHAAAECEAIREQTVRHRLRTLLDFIIKFQNPSAQHPFSSTWDELGLFVNELQDRLAKAHLSASMETVLRLLGHYETQMNLPSMIRA